MLGKSLIRKPPRILSTSSSSVSSSTLSLSSFFSHICGTFNKYARPMALKQIPFYECIHIYLVGFGGLTRNQFHFHFRFHYFATKKQSNKQSAQKFCLSVHFATLCFGLLHFALLCCALCKCSPKVMQKKAPARRFDWYQFFDSLVLISVGMAWRVFAVVPLCRYAVMPCCECACSPSTPLPLLPLLLLLLCVFTEMCCNADNLFRLALFYIQTDTCSQLHSLTHILRQQTNLLTAPLTYSLFPFLIRCVCAFTVLSHCRRFFSFCICDILYTYTMKLCAFFRSLFFSVFLIFHISFRLICNETSRRVTAAFFPHM